MLRSSRHGHHCAQGVWQRHLCTLNTPCCRTQRRLSPTSRWGEGPLGYRSSRPSSGPSRRSTRLSIARTRHFLTGKSTAPTVPTNCSDSISGLRKSTVALRRVGLHVEVGAVLGFRVVAGLWASACSSSLVTRRQPWRVVEQMRSTHAMTNHITPTLDDMQLGRRRSRCHSRTGSPAESPQPGVGSLPHGCEPGAVVGLHRSDGVGLHSPLGGRVIAA